MKPATLTPRFGDKRPRKVANDSATSAPSLPLCLL